MTNLQVTEVRGIKVLTTRQLTEYQKRGGDYA